MKSTGEVMGIDRDFPTAFLKSQMGAGVTLPDRRRGLRVSEGQRQDGDPAGCEAADRTGLLRLSQPAAPNNS